MAHHSYVYAGDRKTGIALVRTFAEESLGLSGANNPDLSILEYGLFSVDNAREVARFAGSSAVSGDARLIAIATTRLFHEAQNALLKLFEEPAVGLTLVLIVPAEGMLLPTLRSRVITLPGSESPVSGMAEEFIALDIAGKEKYISKLLDRTKSDKDDEKQAARGECIALVEGLLRAGYAAQEKDTGATNAELIALLSDLDAFLPILHERSAPLKLIFEHVLLVFPASLRT